VQCPDQFYGLLQVFLDFVAGHELVVITRQASHQRELGVSHWERPRSPTSRGRSRDFCQVIAAATASPTTRHADLPTVAAD
jgi:hypothetical protein